jgi:hypothetical protein
MNPWAIVAALVIWGATGAGAWFYRAHIDAQDVTDAQDAVAAASARAAEMSKASADAATQAAQAAADARSLALQTIIDKQKAQYDSQLEKARAALRRLPSCPVPVNDVGMLVIQSPTAGSGSGGVQADTRSSAGSAPGGTVDASALIASCEVNRAAFERNINRLNACINAFDSARAEVNAK